MKIPGMIRRSVNQLANESMEKHLLDKIPQRLKEKLYAGGGEIVVNVENNSYTISGRSKALADEIHAYLSNK